MPRKSPLSRYPDRKISETFLLFAEPLLEGMGPDVTKHQLEEALQVAFTVWNAVVYATTRGEKRFLDMVRELTAPEPQLAAVIEQLIARKYNLFGDDIRVVGQYKVTKKNGELNLWAEARSPWPSN